MFPFIQLSQSAPLTFSTVHPCQDEDLDQLDLSVADEKDGHHNEIGETHWAEILERTYSRNNLNQEDTMELETFDKEDSMELEPETLDLKDNKMNLFRD